MSTYYRARAFAMKDQLGDDIEQKRQSLQDIQKSILSKKISFKNAVSLRSPILVITYKNHALDEFLEGCLSFCKEVVRIGGRSQSDKLAELNLSRLLGGEYSKDDRRIFSTIKDELNLKLEEIKNLIQQIKDSQGQSFGESILKKQATQVQYEALHKKLSSWIPPEKKKKEKKKEKTKDPKKKEKKTKEEKGKSKANKKEKGSED